MGLNVETSFVRRGLVVVLALAGLLLAGNGAQAWLHSEPSRIELVTRCLEREKGLVVLDPDLDAAAFGTDASAVQTTIETNEVVIAVAGSLAEARQLEQAAVALAGRGRVERRADVVYEWERAPSPTQRQGAYDCTY